MRFSVPSSRKLLLSAVAASSLTLAACQSMAETQAAPRGAAGAFLAGRFAQNANDWGAAAAYMGQALVADPSNLDLLRRTFLLSLGDGGFDVAEALAHDVERVEPRNFMALLTLAVADARAGRYPAADKRLDAAAPDGLSGHVAPFVKAWLHVGRKQFAAAREALAPLDGVEGVETLYALHRGLIEEAAGDRAAAEAAYRAGLDKGRSLRLVQALGRLLERAGRTAEAQALFAEFRAKRIDPATAAAEEALSAATLFEPSPTTAMDGVAEALMNVATALQRENSDMALLFGQLARAAQPDAALPNFLVADVLASRRRAEQSLDYYVAAAKADPNVAWTARLQQAAALQNLGRGADAEALLRAMAAERPDEVEPLVRLAGMQRADGRFDAEAATLDLVAARLTPDDDRAWTVYYQRGVALDRAGKREQAEIDLLRAMELRPDYPHLLNYLGYSWVERGVNLERAEAMIRKALAQRPQDGYILDSLGWAQFKQGRVEEALESLERAVLLAPRDPTVNDHLGDVYWTVGRKKEAEFQWRRALQTTQDAELRAALEAKLASGLPRARTASNQSAPTPAPIP